MATRQLLTSTLPDSGLFASPRKRHRFSRHRLCLSPAVFVQSARMDGERNVLVLGPPVMAPSWRRIS